MDMLLEVDIEYVFKINQVIIFCVKMTASWPEASIMKFWMLCFSLSYDIPLGIPTSSSPSSSTQISSPCSSSPTISSAGSIVKWQSLSLTCLSRALLRSYSFRPKVLEECL